MALISDVVFSENTINTVYLKRTCTGRAGPKLLNIFSGRAFKNDSLSGHVGIFKMLKISSRAKPKFLYWCFGRSELLILKDGPTFWGPCFILFHESIGICTWMIGTGFLYEFIYYMDLKMTVMLGCSGIFFMIEIFSRARLFKMAEFSDHASQSD